MSCVIGLRLGDDWIIWWLIIYITETFVNAHFMVLMKRWFLCFPCRLTNCISQAPPRADVVKSLKNGILLNVLGMGAAILGMQSTVGFLVAKALTSTANPYYQGVTPGYSPVLALDVFLVQVPVSYFKLILLSRICKLWPVIENMSFGIF